LKTGRVIYECSFHGCSRDPGQSDGDGDDGMEDVLVVQRESQVSIL
jgi:hypothetical protein